MALTINHSITGAIDGSYFVLKATNDMSDYTDNGIDIDTDSESLDLDVSYNGTSIGSISLDAANTVLFLSSGVKIYPSSFSLTTFSDGLYSTTVTTTISSVEYESSDESILYGIVEASAIKYIFNTDWKNSYKDINIYFDNSIKIKSWLNNIKLANDNDLPNEGSRILTSLQRAIL